MFKKHVRIKADIHKFFHSYFHVESIPRCENEWAAYNQMPENSTMKHYSRERMNRQIFRDPFSPSTMFLQEWFLLFNLHKFHRIYERRKCKFNSAVMDRKFNCYEWLFSCCGRQCRQCRAMFQNLIHFVIQFHSVLPWVWGNLIIRKETITRKTFPITFNWGQFKWDHHNKKLMENMRKTV